MRYSNCGRGGRDVIDLIWSFWGAVDRSFGLPLHLIKWYKIVPVGMLIVLIVVVPNHPDTKVSRWGRVLPWAQWLVVLTLSIMWLDWIIDGWARHIVVGTVWWSVFLLFVVHRLYAWEIAHQGRERD